MDGTLLDLNFDNQFWLNHVPSCYAIKNGIEHQTALDIILPKMKSVRGSLDWYDVHYWSHELELDILALKQDLIHLIQVRPGVHDFLKALVAHNKTIWLATNAHHDTIPVKFNRTHLRPYFTQVISSSDLGAPKEATEFWQRLNRRHPFDLKTSLFIDDNLPILRTAKEYGIPYLLTVTRPDLSGAELRQNEFSTVDHFHDITPFVTRHTPT